MKIKYLMVIAITIIINMYLIFIWIPDSNSENVTVSAYKNNNISSDQELDINDSLKSEESYYLNQGNLLENLSDDDVEELNNTLNKLSTSDLSKWLKVKQNKNDENLVEFFKLIKKRMSNDDYEKIKGILGKIIDVNSVELNI